VAKSVVSAPKLLRPSRLVPVSVLCVLRFNCSIWFCY